MLLSSATESSQSSAAPLAAPAASAAIPPHIAAPAAPSAATGFGGALPTVTGCVVYVGDDHALVVTADPAATGGPGGPAARLKFHPRDMHLASDDAPLGGSKGGRGGGAADRGGGRGGGRGGRGRGGAGAGAVAGSRDETDAARSAAFRALSAGDDVTFVLLPAPFRAGAGSSDALLARDGAGIGSSASAARPRTLSSYDDDDADGAPSSHGVGSDTLTARLHGGVTGGGGGAGGAVPARHVNFRVARVRRYGGHQLPATPSLSTSGTPAPHAVAAVSISSATAAEIAAARRAVADVEADPERAIAAATTLRAIAGDSRLYLDPSVAGALLAMLAAPGVAAHPRADRLYAAIGASSFVADPRGARSVILQLATSASAAAPAAGGDADTDGFGRAAGHRAVRRCGGGGGGSSSDLRAASRRLGDAAEAVLQLVMRGASQSSAPALAELLETLASAVTLCGAGAGGGALHATLAAAQSAFREQRGTGQRTAQAASMVQGALATSVAGAAGGAAPASDSAMSLDDGWPLDGDFRYASIFPSAEELAAALPSTNSDTVIGSSVPLDPQLAAHVVRGRYPTAAHYLDTIFRLLREDLMAPLRAGLVAYRAWRSRYVLATSGAHAASLADAFHHSHRDVRVYYDGHIEGLRCTRAGVTMRVSFSSLGNRGVDWDRSKRLLYGSLVLLSPDDFAPGGAAIVCATVAERDAALMRGSGPRRIDLALQGGFDARLDPGASYTIIEASAGYFEAYVHVLRALQAMDVGAFAGNAVLRAILDPASAAAVGVSPPSYLTAPGACAAVAALAGGGTDAPAPDDYDLSSTFPALARATGSAIVIPVLESPWPISPSDTSLDDTQLAALQMSLTRSLAVVQGPPGCGKTFVGLQVMRALLRNVSGRLSHRPILVVCYTNHALDQFLEGVAAFEESIVRVGSRSRSEDLARFGLKSVVRAARETEKRAGVGAERARLRRALLARQGELEAAIAETASTLEATTRSGILEEGDLALVAPRRALRAIFHGAVAPDDEDDGGIDGVDDAAVPAAERWRRWLGADPRDVASCRDDETRHAALVDTLMLHRSAAPQGVVAEVLPPSPVTGIGERDGTDDEDDDGGAARDINPVDELRDLLAEDEAATAASRPRRGGSSAGSGRRAGFATEAAAPAKVIALTATPLPEPPRRRPRNSRGPTGGVWGPARSRAPPPAPVMLTCAEVEASVGATGGAGHTGDEVDADAADAALRGSRDLWGLPRYDRARLYRIWLRAWHADCLSVLGASVARYEAVTRELGALVADEELTVLSTARVVGLTTTAVAKHRRLLAALRPEVIIVEEAAEVLEAHIVSAIGHDTAHVVLIGDHQQLRPSTAVYALATRYNLDVSLFERLVANGFPHVTLGRQRRMRPAISALIAPLYPGGLADHPVVSAYPPVRGLGKNVFFLDHDVLEDSAGSDAGSKSNAHEAAITYRLARHLLAQGYAPSDITVLTPYVGQLHALRAHFRGRDDGVEASGGAVGSAVDVRLTTVDNFQGEESTIIILSLVRSNSERSIGFLGIANRVCVALSRAKHGMIIIGNATLLLSASALWRAVLANLEASNSVGRCLPLTCVRHPDRVTHVASASDFDAARFGGCDKVCDESLPCGHSCGRSCHPYSHASVRCGRPCSRVFACGHACPKRCHEDCGTCSVPTPRTLSCGHAHIIPCGVRLDTVECSRPCERELCCGHRCGNVCAAHCTVYCTVSVDKLLQCGHTVPLPCAKDPADATCEVIVDSPAVYTGPNVTMRCIEAQRIVRSVAAR